MTSTLAFPHSRAENTLQAGSVDAHAHSVLPATAQATAVQSEQDAAATGSARADSPVFAWLQASAQTLRSAATALRDEARQHLPAPKAVAAQAMTLGTATLRQLSTAAEEVRAFILAETTQSLLSNTLDSCISLTDKAFKSVAGPLAELPAQTSQASAFVLKWAAAAVPGSRVVCSAALAKLQDLGSTLWHTYQNSGAEGAEKSASAPDLTAWVDMPANADTSHAVAGAATAPIPPIAPAPESAAPNGHGLAPDDVLSTLTQADSMGAPADSDTDDADSQPAPDLPASLNRTLSEDLPQHPTEVVLITGRMESTEGFDGAIAPII